MMARRKAKQATRQECSDAHVCREAIKAGIATPHQVAEYERFTAMTVGIRSCRRGGFEVDIRFTWPDGAPFRERLRSPVTGKSASQRWGEARETELLRAGRVHDAPGPISASSSG